MNCDYCKTIHEEQRCPSCGAPKKERKVRMMINTMHGPVKFDGNLLTMTAGGKPQDVRFLVFE